MERNSPQVADVIDLADIFRSIRNRWLIIAGITAASVAVAAGIVLLASPTFESKASVLLKTGSQGSGSSLSSVIGSLAEGAGGAGMAGGLLSTVSSGVETEIEILKSRALAAEVVDSLRLQAQIKEPRSTESLRAFSRLALPGSFKPRVYQFTRAEGAAGRYRFFSESDSGEAIVGQPATLAIGSVVITDSAPHSFVSLFLDREDAISGFSKNLAFEKPRTDVAHFAFTAADSVTAARAPNLLINLYMNRRKGVDRGLNQQTAEFLAQKVDSVGKALVDAERALRAQREANGAIEPLAVSATEYANENRLRQQLIEIQLQERTLLQLVEKINAGTASPVQLASYPQYLGSGPINNIVNSLISVETERQALLGTVTEQDERVKALTTRAKELEARLMPLAQTTLATLATQRTALDQRVKGIQESLVGVPRAAEQYTRLEREILDLGQIYAGLQVKLVDARLNAITEGGDVRALDLASIPKKPEFPKPALMLAGGLGGGLFLGVIVAVLLGIMGERMYDARDVERRIGLSTVRLESSTPLLIGAPTSRTIIVAPVDARAQAHPVAQRIIETALSRAHTATLLDLSNGHRPALLGSVATVPAGQIGVPGSFDANAAIRRLEETHDVVVVQLPSLSSSEAGAVLDATRPVVLVAPERRIGRTDIQAAVDLLRRVGAPCAGVVLHGDDRRRVRA